MRNPFTNELVAPGEDTLKKNSAAGDMNTIFEGGKPQNTFMCCPKGYGKSTFIRSYFSEARKAEFALTKKLLISVCTFSASQFINDASVFLAFIEAVKNSLNNLPEDHEDYIFLEGKFTDIPEELKDYETNYLHGREILILFNSLLGKRGYHVTFIMENFENLTNSEAIDSKTFNYIAYLMTREGSVFSCIPVTGYHIRVGSANFALSEFERIFNTPTPLTTPKLKYKKKWEMIQTIVEKKVTDFLEYYDDDDDAPSEPFALNETELEKIFTLTDGIPGLIQDSLCALFDFWSSRKCKAPIEEYESLLLEGCRSHFDIWVKYFSENENFRGCMECILQDNSYDAVRANSDADYEMLQMIITSGLIELEIRSNTLKFACPLFEDYMGECIARNAGKKKDCPVIRSQDAFESGSSTPNAEIISLLRGLGENLKGSTNVFVQEGGTYVNMIGPVTVNNGIQMQELVSMILHPEGLIEGGDSYQQLLGKAIQSRFSQSALMVQGLPDPSDPEYEQKCEIAYSDAAEQLIIDDGTEDGGLSPEEVLTLDQRYETARERLGHNISDTWLNSLGSRCRLFIKMAVIVEDALNFPGNIFDDYSPHIVFYGKALELSLRENLYDYFHQDATLREYNLSFSGTSTFKRLRKDKSYIGNYTTLLQNPANIRYIAMQCMLQGVVEGKDQRAWEAWWSAIYADMDQLRETRNKIHAGDTPTKAEFETMFAKLMDSETEPGMISKLAIGTSLVGTP